MHHIHYIWFLLVSSINNFKNFFVLKIKSKLHLRFSCKRHFETSVQPNACNFFVSLLIRRICCLLSRCWIWLVDVSLVIQILQCSKDEFWLRIQAIWNSLPLADIQNIFHSMPCRIVALITARGGYTKY